MPHPRPTGPSEALSTRLRSATSEIHKEAERRPFMRAFFAGGLPRLAYVDWLGRQWHIYRALENALRALPPSSAEATLVPAALHRTERLTDDLTVLTEGTWAPEAHLSPATSAYVDRIEAAGSFPPGLIAHAWLRYMGNVGGRDVLRRLAAASLAIDEDADRGLAFVDYAGVGEIRPFFAAFHAALDALDLDEAAATRVVTEAEAGFRLNIDLTDELARDHGIA